MRCLGMGLLNTDLEVKSHELLGLISHGLGEGRPNKENHEKFQLAQPLSWFVAVFKENSYQSASLQASTVRFESWITFRIIMVWLGR